MTGETFTDYYAVLLIAPDCDARALEAAYHRMAKLYHPDHAETADVSKFSDVVAAYKVLRDPQTRADYDLLHAERVQHAWTGPAPADAFEFDEEVALDDADAQAKFLMLLYRKRRAVADNAGIGTFLIQEYLGCTDELFEFHRWFLKEKGFIQITEQGTLAITIEGVDHVMAMSRKNRAERLLSDQSGRQ